MAGATHTPYPIQFDVEYPERQSRWKALFRILLVLPAFLFIAFASYAWLFSLPVMWLAILIRGRIPRWLFDFQVGYVRFLARTRSYFLLLTDVYPAWDGDYPVKYQVTYPERTSRWKVVVWKLGTALPQLVVVSVLQSVSLALTAVGWMAIMFTGQYPKGLHASVVGVIRWEQRVLAYLLSFTDEYPPYSTEADAPATTGGAYVASSVVGVLAIAGLVAGVVSLIVFVSWGGEDRVVQVSYSRLLDGEIRPGETFIRVNSIDVELVSAVDPADDSVALIEPLPGHRLVLFTFVLTNVNDDSDAVPKTIFGNDFQTVDSIEAERDPILAIVGRRPPPVGLRLHETVRVDVVFELPRGMRPDEVSYGGGFLSDTAVYEFR